MSQCQNRRLKVFNRGALHFCRGGFGFVRGGLTLQKLTKYQLIYSVSCFSLGGLGALFGGLSPQKPPVATGLHNAFAFYLDSTNLGIGVLLPGPDLAGAGPNARPRHGAPLRSGVITPSCSAYRAITFLMEIFSKITI